MKFKSDIEVQAGLRDSSGSTGASGQILSSNGNTVSWVPAGSSVASDVQNEVKAGVAINKGQAVYVTSADGTNIIVGLASNTTEATSSKTLGLLNATVAINGFADVVQIGRLAGINTLAATVGDPVWLGSNGNLIYGLINKPYAPLHLVFIGIVTRVNANNGEIFVNVQNGFELNEIHDVDLKTNVPINGDILGYNGTLWVNKTIAGWLGYTPANQAITIATTAPLSGGGDLSANRTLSISQAGAASNGYLSANDWGIFNGKQNALNGTGFVKASGTTISYDNSTYTPTSRTITINGVTQDLSANQTWTIASGVTSFNTRTGAVTLTSGDVTTALGYTPYNSSNPNGYISSYTETDTLASVTGRGAITSGDIYTPNNGGIFFNGNGVYGSGIFGRNFGQDLGLNAGGLERVSIASNGAVTANVSFRSPIIYDSNDTTYYADFSSTSNSLYLAGQIYTTKSTGTLISINGVDTIGYNSTTGGAYLKGTGNSYIYGGGLYFDGSVHQTLIHTGNISSYAVPTSRTITINGTSYDLSANRSWTVTASETDTLQTVTSRGNTTTTSITANSVIIPSFETASNVLSFRSGIPDGTNVGIRAKATVTANRDGLELLGYNGIDFSINNGNTVAGKFNNYGQFLVNAASSGYGSMSYGYNLGMRGTTSQAYMSIALSNQTLDTQGLIVGIDTNYARFHVRDSKTISFANGDVERMTLDTSANLIANGSVRAPIFYDSNNTGFYLNPYGQSIFGSGDQYVLRLEHTAAQGDFVDALYVQNNESGGRVQIGMSANGTDGQHHRVSLRAYKGSGNLEGTFGIALRQASTAHTQRLTLTAPGDLTVDSSMRAPIFYDSNDTGYYGDFASTSNFRNLLLNNQTTINTTTPGLTSYGLTFMGGNSDQANGMTWTWGDTNAQAGIYVQSSGAYGTKMYFATTDSFATGAKTAMAIDHYGNVSLNRGTFNNGSVWINNGVNYNSYNENIRLFNATNGVSVIAFGASGTSGTPQSSILGFSDRLEIRVGSNGTAVQRNYDNYVEAMGSSRAPIFYDSNNTGYYVDPASTSRLNTLTLSALASDDGMIENNTGGYFHLGGWGVGRTAATAVLVNTAYRSDYADDAVVSNYSRMDYLMSLRDFPNGTLIQTSIDYSVTNGDPFVLEIKGNSYGNIIPMDIQIQGYIYANTIINTGGYSNGFNVTGIRAINYNGYLCFWFPSQGYWNGYTVKVYRAYDGRQANAVTSITNSGLPTTAKQVDFNPVISLRSDNYRGYSNFSGAVYGTIFYDADNTGYYIDPTAISNINNLQIAGGLQVGSGYASSIDMVDIDHGTRTIHCNSNRIGFLNQSSSWGSWCEDNGSWVNETSMNSPIFYDYNNTGYYVDPSNISNLFEANFGDNSNGNQGINIYYGNQTGGYGKIRFYQAGSNHQTIHSFSANWQGGGFGSGNSANAINIDGAAGVTFGGWNVPDAYIAKGGNFWCRYDVIAYSDARVKDNVEVITNALDKIKKVRGVTFTRNDYEDKEKRHTGVIAQEMLEALPEAVTKDSDGMYSVSYGNLAGLFIEAIKEQQTQIEELKELVNKLINKQ